MRITVHVRPRAAKSRVVGAREGTLTVMVGGDDAPREALAECWRAVAGTVVACGGPGSGQQGRAPEHAQGIGRQFRLALLDQMACPLLDQLAQPHRPRQAYTGLGQRTQASLRRRPPRAASRR